MKTESRRVDFCLRVEWVIAHLAHDSFRELDILIAQVWVPRE
jgi:hypothetical protein